FLKQSKFDLVLVETVGIGQEALPFSRSLVDKTVLVMSPDYGSRLQLQKIVMLDRADLVVVNKSDLPGARTALVEVEQRLSMNRPTPDPSEEGSKHSSASCQFPSWEGLGVGSWSQCTTSKSWGLSSNQRAKR